MMLAGRVHCHLVPWETWASQENCSIIYSLLFASRCTYREPSTNNKGASSLCGQTSPRNRPLWSSCPRGSAHHCSPCPSTFLIYMALLFLPAVGPLSPQKFRSLLFFLGFGEWTPLGKWAWCSAGHCTLKMLPGQKTRARGIWTVLPPKCRPPGSVTWSAATGLLFPIWHPYTRLLSINRQKDLLELWKR